MDELDLISLPLTRAEDAAASGPSAELLQWLRGMRLINATLSDVLKSFSLRLEAWEILELLAARPRTYAELSQGIGSTARNTVSRWVVRMQEEGLVVSQMVSGDGRTQTVSITPHGITALQRVRRAMLKALANSVGPGSPSPVRDAVLRFAEILDRRTRPWTDTDTKQA